MKRVLLAILLTIGFIPQHVQAIAPNRTDTGSPIAVIPTLKSLTPPALKTFNKLDYATPVVAASPVYGNPYEAGNCTWYVASRIRVPDDLGNANTWAAQAAVEGYTVSGTPIVGAVAQSTGGYYGHVAIVTAVSGDQVQVSEMNVLGLGVVDSQWYSINHFNNYIYF